MQLLRSDSCPFATRPQTNTKPYWLKPELVAEVKFSQWTFAGYLRHPVFVGLRLDKEPKECRRELKKALPLPLTAPKLQELEVEVEAKKLKLTNLNKIFWPDTGFTKGDLIEYYNLIAEWLLPHLKDRPMVLKRYPDGIKGKFFFQKEAPPDVPSWVKVESVKETDHANNYIIVNDKATLIYLVNLACIDLNPWSSRIGSLNSPDWLLIDLDPFGASFKQVIKVAQVCQEVFTTLGLSSYPKTSGATGMHLYVPLAPAYSYKQVRLLAEIVARLVVDRCPDLATLEPEVTKRQGKVYVDYLQNVRGKTLASVYSLRPKQLACVSTQLHWS
jgi:bifunctional non-homologous end joining protein LigD